MIDYKEAYERLFNAVDKVINEQYENYSLIARNVSSTTIGNSLLIARDTIQKIIDVLEQSQIQLEAANE